MEELFKSIPEEFRKRAEFMVDIVLRSRDIVSAANTLRAYANTCESDEERAFLDFYFNYRMEQIINANSNN